MGVHRVRLVANALVELGWHPIVLTVDEKDYEEPLDVSTQALVDEGIEVIKVRARRVLKLFNQRLVGDIGLRGYHALKKQAINICKSRDIEAAWISIPSWYTSLIGRALHRRTKVPFGIDYQDPWVHDLPPEVSPWSRARLSVVLATILEPMAVKHASFITGINRPYFDGCVKRNPHLERVPQGEMQLGFSIKDHRIPMPEVASPWSNDTRAFIYGGAFLPLSAPNWTVLFQALEHLCQTKQMPEGVQFYLFGTGQTLQQSLAQLAEQHNVGHLVVETPERIPFLQLQELMRRAEGVLSIGSIEPHYSASKTFQCLLSQRKILSMCHPQSQAKSILESCGAHAFHVDSAHSTTSSDHVLRTSAVLLQFFQSHPKSWQPDLTPLTEYTSLESAKTLIRTIESISPTNRSLS